MTRGTTPPRQFAFGPFRLFPAQQLLLEGESPVRLGGRARDLLLALVEQAGQVITKEALSARLWPNIVVEEGTLRVHIAALRKALRDGQEGRRYIANIAGRGYAFVGEVAATDEPDPAADTPPEPPLSMGRLFGRAEVLETLSTRLAQQRFITITGPGGIGKTSVALAVTDQMRPGCRTAYASSILRPSPTANWYRQPVPPHSGSASCPKTRSQASWRCCAAGRC